MSAKRGTCIICEKAMLRKEPVVQLRCKCPDSYLHKQCAVAWLEHNQTCPSCGRDPLFQQKRQYAIAVSRRGKGNGLIYLPWRTSALYQWLYSLRMDAPRSDSIYLLVYLALIVSVVICALSTAASEVTATDFPNPLVFGVIDVVPVVDLLGDTLFK